MALTKPTMAVNIITNLGTTVQERGLTTDQFKAKFDETSAAIKTYLNDVLTAELDLLIATFATLTGTQTLTNKTLTSPKINENVAMTSTSTELNVLDGIPATLTATELGYVDGVTSAIQTQLNAKAAKTQETATGFTFSNGWAATHSSYYYKDEFGVVHLMGRAYGGTTTADTIITNLPAGYRPATQIAGQGVTWGTTDVAAIALSISTGGDITIVNLAKYNLVFNFSFRL